MSLGQKNKSSSKIMMYSVFTAAVLSGNKISGEIVTVNIDPDIVLDEPEEIYYLDMNNDGDADFMFSNTSFIAAVSVYPYEFTFLLRELKAGVVNFNNALAGISSYHDSTSSVEWTGFYPFVLSTSDTIGASQQWQNAQFQLLASHKFFDYGTDPAGSGGYWAEGYIGKFIGVRFQDKSFLNHFGWIRCDVLENSSTLIIKDFAYESQPNLSLKAGQTAYDVQSGFEIYASNNIIYISFHYPFNEVAVVTIYDINGKLVQKREINKSYTWFIVDSAPGIYFVNLKSENIDKTISVQLN